MRLWPVLMVARTVLVVTRTVLKQKQKVSQTKII